jgi:DsbC/DsbD-like thiol-disulfide interchange protein
VGRNLRLDIIWTVFPVLVATVWFLPATDSLAQNPTDEHVKVELVSEEDAMVPGRPIELGIRFDLQEGWHTYWMNPGDAGEAPRIEWTLPAGFEAGSIQWPYPMRLATPPFMDYGYEHQVLLPVTIRTPSALTVGGSEKLVANIRYLICREVCIPGKAQLVLELPVKDRAGASTDAKLFDSTRRQLPKPMPAGWKISATLAGDEFHLRLRGAQAIASAQFFPGNPEQIDNAAEQNVSAIPGGFVLPLKKSNHMLKPISRLRGVLVVAGVAYVVDVPVAQSAESDSAAKSKQN